MQKARDQGRVMTTRRALSPVSRTVQGPGPVGSAVYIAVSAECRPGLTFE